MPKTRICSRCSHQEVCGVYKKIVKIVSNWEQFDVKLTHMVSIYKDIAEMCKRYKLMGGTDG